jgi:hypothetical protein
MAGNISRKSRFDQALFLLVGGTAIEVIAAEILVHRPVRERLAELDTFERIREKVDARFADMRSAHRGWLNRIRSGLSAVAFTMRSCLA